MTDERPEVVATWFAVYVRRGTELRLHREAPSEPAALALRMEERLEGRRTEEERWALEQLSDPTAVSWDRRLGLESPKGRPVPFEPPGRPERALHRQVLLEVAERRLAAGWDPSVHVDEAVRSVGELDQTLNLLGERLVSWAGRDAVPSEDEGAAAEVARRLADAVTTTSPMPGLPPGDPALAAARRELAKLYERVAGLRGELERAIEEAMPRRAPNLSALLGPLLAARIVSQAGGLDRLARLPASTIQVLGAERAFFEHLRGRAPPPRHGWLFLHPEVQSAPRRVRGRVARALAGKAAIAARLDAEGRPLRADLLEQFRRRSRSARGEGPGGKRRRSGADGPLSPAT